MVLLIINSMNDTECLPAPVIETKSPEPTAWQRERHAFGEMLPSLLQTHLGKYVAVYGGQVVDSDEDEVRLAARAYQNHGYVPIYVGLVTKQTPIVRIPHRRELTRTVCS